MSGAMSKLRAIRLLAGAALVVLALAACGVPTTSPPTAITEVPYNLMETPAPPTQLPSTPATRGPFIYWVNAADQLIATGKATHPIIGVLLDRTYAGEGAQVQDSSDAVTQDGPADKAGVQPGDVIVSFEGKPIRTPDQLIVSIRARAVGETVTLTIERDGQRRELQMTLEAQPDE